MIHSCSMSAFNIICKYHDIRTIVDSGHFVPGKAPLGSFIFGESRYHDELFLSISKLSFDQPQNSSDRICYDKIPVVMVRGFVFVKECDLYCEVIVVR